MVAIINYVASTKKYIKGTYNGHPVTINGVFADAIFNGSMVYSIGYEESRGILTNATLKDWQQKSSDLAKTANLKIDFEDINPNRLTVTQTDPWNILISIPVDYNLSDPISGVKWTRKAQINTTLSIVNNFEDPVYVAEFGSACGNKILKSPYQPLVNNESFPCDAENLTKFFDTPWKGSMYIASNNSPSYLSRLGGSFHDCQRLTRMCIDYNGIESMINPQKWADCGLVNGTSTIVDFRYGYIDGEYHVSGTDSFVYLAENDFAPYKISEDCMIN
jgi:hypothetical protein